MITQRMMVKGIKSVPDVWSFTINTGNLKKTGIPISLYNQPDIVISVDWGDGETSVLTSANYVYNDTTASIHEYSDDGVYKITLRIKNAQELFLQYHGAQLSSVNNYNGNLYYFRKTIITNDSAIPLVAGIETYWSDSWTRTNNELRRLFFYCENLTTLDIDTFASNPQITDLSYQFNHSPMLGDFSLRITAEGINNLEAFCIASSGAARTIYVPAGSTTETTFNTVASDLGLTIIGE